MATLFPGQSLLPGQSLQSDNQWCIRLLCSPTGMLFSHNSQSKPLWRTGTGGD